MPLPPSQICVCECACFYLKNEGELKNLVFMAVLFSKYSSYLIKDILQLEEQEKPAALCSVRRWL